MFKKWFGLDKNKEKEEELNELQPELSAEEEQEAIIHEIEVLTAEEIELAESDTEPSETEIAEVTEINEVAVETVDSVVTTELEPQTEPEPTKASFFNRLLSGLSKTSQTITDKLDRLINTYGEIDEDLFDELEEILITSDMGMSTTMEVIDRLKAELNKRKINDASMVKGVLRDVMVTLLNEHNQSNLSEASPLLILVIGVNGAGKTTSIGKIAHRYKSQGKRVMLAAGDTFRAAAIDQLKVWGDRAGIGVISHQEGADPAAVIFDAIQAAKSRSIDVLICDTAGRLHNKKNLMNELAKVYKVIEREYPEAEREVLLVLDATTGQNAVQQAKTFSEISDITGIVLTKLDGTAKGGVVLSINSELNIPVKLIGVGEGMHDLQDFDAETFVSALLKMENN